MSVINRMPSQKILQYSKQRFVLNFFVVIKIILIFPIVLIMSKYYVRLLWKFCNEYQRDGIITNEKGQVIEFNSMDLYYDDLQNKKMSKFETRLHPTIDKNEFILRNRNGQGISCLIIQSLKSDKWVIGLHGWTENKYLGLRLVDHFLEKNYNILTFDAPAHGLSYGDYTDVGYKTADDLEDIIRWLKKIHAVSEIGIIGNSMGAATACFYIGKYGKEHPELKWAVADSGFANLLEQFHYVMQYRYQKPWWLISWGLSKLYYKKTKVKLKDYNILKVFKNCSNIPILFAHGTGDTFVPVFMSKKLFNTKIYYEKKQITEIYLPNNVEHVRIIADCNSEYREIIGKFIKKVEQINEI